MAELILQVSVKSYKSISWHDDGVRSIRLCCAHWVRKRADAARRAGRGGEAMPHCVGMRGSGRTGLGGAVWTKRFVRALCGLGVADRCVVAVACFGGDRFDLATIRARKATMERRSPLANNSVAHAHRAAHDSRDHIRRGVPPTRSEHARGFESNAQKVSSSPTNKALERRNACGGMEEVKKRGHEGVQQKIDDEMPKNPKRIRADDQGVSSKIPRIKHIFVDGVNHKEKADSFWDMDDPGIGWKKGRSIVGDYDMVHLVSFSTDTFAHSLAWNSCQGLSLASAVRVREEKLRNDQDKIREEVARLKEETFHLLQDKEKVTAEFLQVQVKLVDKSKDFATLEEKYATEVKTGGQFLGSEAGKILLKSTEEKGAQNFKASSAFQEEVLDRAMFIHDEVVLDCRNQLRKNLVPKEIVMLIEPSVLEMDGGSMDGVPLDNAEMIEALKLHPTEEES